MSLMVILLSSAVFLLERIQVRYLLNPFGARSRRAHRVLLHYRCIFRVQLVLNLLFAHHNWLLFCGLMRNCIGLSGWLGSLNLDLHEVVLLLHVTLLLELNCCLPLYFWARRLMLHNNFTWNLFLATSYAAPCRAYELLRRNFGHFRDGRADHL